MRKIRRFIRMTVPAVGMALVIGTVLFGENLAIQFFLVLAGLLLVEAGMGRLADPILPDERKYVALRVETDHFKDLVRQLNTAALALDQDPDAEPPRALDEVQAEMHRSVDRMLNFAGKTRQEVPPDQAGQPAERARRSDPSSTATVGV